jgi:hypothetical protein
MKSECFTVVASVFSVGLVFSLVAVSMGQQPPAPASPPDAVAQAQQATAVQVTRPEQNKTDHDRSNVFYAPNAKPSSPPLNDQPKQGKNSGF